MCVVVGCVAAMVCRLGRGWSGWLPRLVDRLIRFDSLIDLLIDLLSLMIDNANDASRVRVSPVGCVSCWSCVGRCLGGRPGWHARQGNTVADLGDQTGGRRGHMRQGKTGAG